jgi:hypothetical protein
MDKAFLTTPLLLRTSHRIHSRTFSAGWLRSVRRAAYAYLTEISQRMAENTLGILQYLSSDASPLPSLTKGYARPATVFFTQFGHFFQFQFATARLMYGALFALSLTLTRFAYRKRVPGTSSMSFLTEQWVGVRALLVAFVGALIGANGLAAIVHRVLGRNMSWFASEHSALLLYGPAIFSGSSSTLSSSDFPFFLRGSCRHVCIADDLSQGSRAHRPQRSVVDAIWRGPAAPTVWPRLCVPFVPWRCTIIRRAVT